MATIQRETPHEDSKSGADDAGGGFRPGQLVEIRSLGEIRATLDARGTLDGLPFMPEMARFCGKTFRVCRTVERTCVEGRPLRRMTGGGVVFLENLRCDGAAHDGCQRGCLIFWREAWLRPAETDAAGEEKAEPPGDGFDPPEAAALPTRDGEQYFCQSTELAAATEDYPRHLLRPFLRDLRSGELAIPRFARMVWRAAVNRLRRLAGRPPQGQLSGLQIKPPKGNLDLKPGEWVEIKSRAEIEATLDGGGKNRGLSFEAEMLEHCGRRYRVAFQVRRIINEQTGKMVQLSNTVVLDGVVCQGTCNKKLSAGEFPLLAGNLAPPRRGRPRVPSPSGRGLG